MTYLYRSDEGEMLEKDFLMGTAPPHIDEGGKVYYRVFSTGGTIFYGPGFHQNDYSKSPIMRVPRKDRL